MNEPSDSTKVVVTKFKRSNWLSRLVIVAALMGCSAVFYYMLDHLGPRHRGAATQVTNASSTDYTAATRDNLIRKK